MQIIGVDLGGTQMRAGLVKDSAVITTAAAAVKPGGAKEEILDDLCDLIAHVRSPEVKGIGVGAPSVVDTEKGIVYDVINIPSWQEVHLAEALRDRFGVPVFVNNDANCFAVGEMYFGKTAGFRDSVGLIVGTGLGAGVIINHKLYSGSHCGAGEFGMIAYQDGILEHYGSGQFFQRRYGRNGEEVAAAAGAGDEEALAIFAEFGRHLSEAFKIILYALDPQIIVMGGSVSKSFAFFQHALYQGLQTFVYSHSLAQFKITVSELPQAAILGAAALYLDATA